MLSENVHFKEMFICTPVYGTKMFHFRSESESDHEQEVTVIDSDSDDPFGRPGSRKVSQSKPAARAQRGKRGGPVAFNSDSEEEMPTRKRRR